jgi:hypothetical protein
MLRQLYQQTTGSMNPSYLTGVLPGGAGAATAGTTPNPGISAPWIEDYELEVFDVTAPSLIGTANPGKTLGTPAIAGKLLQLDPANSGPGGWLWKQNAKSLQPIPGGQYGIVVKPASPNASGNFLNGSVATGTAGGNIAVPGDKALVVIDGPVQAYVNTTVTATAVSAGMPLASDGAGNLTYAGASPSAGVVLATAMGPVAVSISVPVLTNVFLGGY